MKRPREAGTRPHDLRRDPADDCETPLEAYVHVAFVLSKISQKKNVRKSALRVYDPYSVSYTHLTLPTIYSV